VIILLSRNVISFFKGFTLRLHEKLNFVISLLGGGVLFLSYLISLSVPNGKLERWKSRFSAGYITRVCSRFEGSRNTNLPTLLSIFNFEEVPNQVKAIMACSALCRIYSTAFRNLGQVCTSIRIVFKRGFLKLSSLVVAPISKSSNNRRCTMYIPSQVETIKWKDKVEEAGLGMKRILYLPDAPFTFVLQTPSSPYS